MSTYRIGALFAGLLTGAAWLAATLLGVSEDGSAFVSGILSFVLFSFVLLSFYLVLQRDEVE